MEEPETDLDSDNKKRKGWRARILNACKATLKFIRDLLGGYSGAP